MYKKKVVKEAVHFIISCSDRELSLLNVEGLARKLRRNRSALSREFKNHTNLLLKDYIIQEKIIRIIKLLESADRPCIQTIVLQFGFKKIERFNKCFIKIYCITPYQYLKIRAM